MGENRVERHEGRMPAGARSSTLHTRLFALVGVAFTVFVATREGEALTARAGIRGQCTKNTDCLDNLLCVGSYCRLACTSNRDCQPGETCMRRYPESWSKCAPSVPKPIQWEVKPAGYGITRVAVQDSGTIYALGTLPPQKQTKERDPFGLPKKSLGPTALPTTSHHQAPLLKWTGSDWTTVPAPASMKRIAASNGVLWALDSNGGVHKLANSQWSTIKGTLDEITVDHVGNPVGVKDGHAYRYHGGVWSGVGTFAVSHGSFCAQPGALCWWGAQPTGKVVFLEVSPGTPGAVAKGTGGATVIQATPYSQRPGENVRRIAAYAYDEAWSVTTANEIYHWQYGGWDRQPGAATDISVGADGEVWIVGTDGQPYRGR